MTSDARILTGRQFEAITTKSSGCPDILLLLDHIDALEDIRSREMAESEKQLDALRAERDAAIARAALADADKDRKNQALGHWHLRVKQLMASEEALRAHLAETRERGQQLADALWLASIRLGILTARMRACRLVSGGHELIEEAEMFAAEAKAVWDAAEAKAQEGTS